MRRTSALANRLSIELQEQGLDVQPRRLEGWATAGLAANDEMPIEAQVAHYAVLARISGPGHDADSTAVRLAANGRQCPRLRRALLGRLGLSSEAAPIAPIDLSTSPSGDEAFHEIEGLATAMANTTQMLPPTFRRVIDLLRGNAYRHADKLGEPGDAVFHSFIVSGLVHLLGGDAYNEKALGAVMDIDPDEIGPEYLEFLNTLGVSAMDMLNTCRYAPLEQVVAVAAWMRERAPAAVSYLGLSDVSDEELDDLSATFAPIVLYGFGVLVDLAQQDDKLQKYLSGLELPMLNITCSSLS